MPAPGILTGSAEDISTGRVGALNLPQPSAQVLWKNIAEGETTRAESNLGVFGRHPGATPKYAINRGARDAEYRETLSRIYIDIPDKAKRDEFFASVSNAARPLAKVLAKATDTGGAIGKGFFDFLMTNAQEHFQEKVQIADTLTDNYVAFYSGQEPPLFTYSGTLLNTYQDDQRVWMLRMYREILRGSRLANRDLVARLRYDSFMVTGYMESLTLGLDGSMVDGSSFTFTMRVKQMSVITPSLGAPSVVEIPATKASTIYTNPFEVTKEEREGSVAPQSPLTANQRPRATASDISPAQNQAQRQALEAAGLSASQIDTAVAAASAARTTPEEDSRNAAARPYTRRVYEQTEGDTGNLTNASQTPEDSNIYGDRSQILIQIANNEQQISSDLGDSVPLSTISEQLKPRQTNRKRGLISTANATG